MFSLPVPDVHTLANTACSRDGDGRDAGKHIEIEYRLDFLCATNGVHIEV